MPQDQNSDRQFIRALAKGLAVLETFTPQRPRQTLTQLTRASGMSLAGVQRITHTLITLGYLDRDRDKRFFLGPRVLALGFSCLQSLELRQLAGSHLRRFAQKIGQTVNLGVLDGSEVLVLFRHEVERFFKYDLQPGSKLPAYCTSMGKVLLASLSGRELKLRIAGMKRERLTPGTITNSRALIKEIKHVREQGFAVSDREATPGLYSLAAPVLNQDSEVAAAVNVSIMVGPDDTGHSPELLDLLIEQGSVISTLLGYQGEYPRIPQRAQGPSHGR